MLGLSGVAKQKDDGLPQDGAPEAFAECVNRCSLRPPRPGLNISGLPTGKSVARRPGDLVPATQEDGARCKDRIETQGSPTPHTSPDSHICQAQDWGVGAEGV